MLKTFTDFSQVTVYHPSDGSDVAHASIALHNLVLYVY